MFKEPDFRNRIKQTLSLFFGFGSKDKNDLLESIRKYLVSLNLLEAIEYLPKPYNIFSDFHIFVANGRSPFQKSFSIDFFSKTEAFSKCLGEFLERTAIYYNPKPVFINSQLDKIKNLYDLVFYEDYHNFFRKVTVKNTDNLRFVKAFEHVCSKNVFYPSEFFEISVSNQNLRVFMHEQNTNGVSGYFSYKEAVYSSILEIVERDSFLCYWLTKISPDRINSTSFKEFLHGDVLEVYAKVCNILEKENIKADFFDISTEVEVPVVLAILGYKNSGGMRKICVTGKGSTFSKAIFSTLGEIIQLCPILKDDVSWKRKVSKMPTVFERPYLYHGETVSGLDFLYEGKVVDLKVLDKEKSVQEDLNELISSLKSKFKDLRIYTHVFYRDFLSKTGFVVVKTVIPNLLPFYLDEENSLYSSQRLKDFINFKTKKEGSGKVQNTLPHPYI